MIEGRSPTGVTISSEGSTMLVQTTTKEMRDRILTLPIQCTRDLMLVLARLLHEALRRHGEDDLP